MYTKKAPSVYIFELCKNVFFTLLIKAKTFTLLHAGWTQERFNVCHFTDANAGRLNLLTSSSVNGLISLFVSPLFFFLTIQNFLLDCLLV
jgi:hypothetical protein